MTGDSCSLLHTHSLSLTSDVVKHVSEFHVGDSSVSVGVEFVHQEHDVHLGRLWLADLHEESLAHLRELKYVKTSRSISVEHHEDLLGVTFDVLKVEIVLLHLVTSEILLSIVVTA